MTTSREEDKMPVQNTNKASWRKEKGIKRKTKLNNTTTET